MSTKKSFFKNPIGNAIKINFPASIFLPLVYTLFYPLTNTSLKPWLTVFFVLALLFFHSPIFTWFVFFLVLSFFYLQPLIQIEGGFIFTLNFIFLIAGGTGCFLLMRLCLSFVLFKLIRKKNLIPKISKTEREALLAGNPWIEKEFFTGQPNFTRLLCQEFPKFKQEEADFLNREAEELCSLSKEWDFIKRKKLSQATENFLKKEKFFGLVIPKQYKGKKLFSFCPCQAD